MNTKVLWMVAACLAPSLASAAVLDVHGEIQINGSTVIDSEGNFVGSIDLPEGYNPDSILRDDYITPNNVAVTYAASTVPSPNCHEWDGCAPSFFTEVKSISGDVQTFTGYDESGAEITSYTRVYSDSGYTQTYADASCSFVLEYSRTLFWPEVLEFNRSYLLTEAGLANNSSCGGDNYNEMWSESIVVHGKTTYSNGDIESDDCVIATQTSKWSMYDKNEDGKEFIPFYPEPTQDTRVYCKGIGAVELVEWSGTSYTNSYKKAISFETLSAAE